MNGARGVKNDPNELPAGARRTPAGPVTEGSFDRMIFFFGSHFHTGEFYKVQPYGMDRRIFVRNRRTNHGFSHSFIVAEQDQGTKSRIGSVRRGLPISLAFCLL